LNWQAKLKVYQKLIEHPEYLAENADLADFYAFNAATSIHYIALLNVENDSLLINQKTVIENIKNNSIDIYQKSELLKQIFTQLENPDLKQIEIDSLLIQLDHFMLELDQSIQLNDFYILQLRSSIGSNIDLIGQLTDSILGTEVYEVNERTMNEMSTSLELNPDEELLNSYESTIYGIASQCPLSGGVAVFKARAFYKMINPNVFYNDAFTCIQSGVVYRKKEIIQQHCNLYPNPTTGLVFVSYSISADASLIITDAIGSVITTVQLNSQSVNATVDLARFNNGIYFYRIINDSNVLYNGKIVLTK
ncbi:MAG: T9SS type A sorting domain-containing protein, partial [Verrucomicrobia bacterium]|nr:T9SS type A sorting domain-containing protein [Verrucomicrobiota bacterium]